MAFDSEAVDLAKHLLDLDCGTCGEHFEEAVKEVQVFF